MCYYHNKRKISTNWKKKMNMFNICYLSSHTHLIWKLHLSPSSSSSPSHAISILLSSIARLPSILFQRGFVNYFINGSIFHHQQPTPRLVIRFALHTNNKTHFLSFIFPSWFPLRWWTIWESKQWLITSYHLTQKASDNKLNPKTKLRSHWHNICFSFQTPMVNSIATSLVVTSWLEACFHAHEDYLLA